MLDCPEQEYQTEDEADAGAPLKIWELSGGCQAAKKHSTLSVVIPCFKGRQGKGYSRQYFLTETKRTKIILLFLDFKSIS